jgi:sigma-E factor negative regulatory protein RseC
MMDRGTVKKTENGFAYIEMELNASCRSCSNKGVCMAGDKPAQLKIENNIGLQENDIVEIDLPPQTKLSAGFLLFILPLLSMFAGYYIAFSISSDDLSGMTGAVIGLAAGVITVIIINKMISQTKHFKPRSIRKVD